MQNHPLNRFIPQFEYLVCFIQRQGCFIASGNRPQSGGGQEMKRRSPNNAD